MNRVQNIVLFLVAVSFGAHAQTFVVKGVVSAATTPVRYAAVAFVDNSDTTRRFSALSDVSGNYEIGIITSVKSKDNLPVGFENDCMNVGMSAYIWWYIVRFYGPIREDGHVSKRGYVMAQFKIQQSEMSEVRLACDAFPNSVNLAAQVGLRATKERVYAVLCRLFSFLFVLNTSGATLRRPLWPDSANV